jgi:hypothetical protein
MGNLFQDIFSGNNNYLLPLFHKNPQHQLAIKERFWLLNKNSTMRKIIKTITIGIAVIIGLVLIARPALSLYGECLAYFDKKAFLAKYEFEDFSQFKNVSLFIRGGDSERNPIIVVDAPHLVRDTLKVGCYVVTLDKRTYQVKEAKWMIEYDVEADTLKLQQLAQTFMRYRIPRLDVDTVGNVFVYVKDVATLALVRFANENELQKRSKETQWINIKSNWYKPR